MVLASTNETVIDVFLGRHIAFLVLLDLAVNAEYFISEFTVIPKSRSRAVRPSIKHACDHEANAKGRLDVRPCEGLPDCMTLRVCCAGPQTKVAAELACPHLPGLSRLRTLKNLALCLMNIIKPQHGWSIRTARSAATTSRERANRHHPKDVSTPSFYARAGPFMPADSSCAGRSSVPLDIDRRKMKGVMSHPRTVRNQEWALRRHKFGTHSEPVRSAL